jgi:DNA-binding MarR family transcriptional regulator
MALSRALVALTVRSLDELDVDITMPQYRTLVVLASQGPQRPADLAGELGVQRSTVTRVCDRLAARGLIERRPGQADRRVIWVVLTDAGKELIGQAMTRRHARLEVLVEQAGVTNQKAFAAAASRLVRAAGELPEAEWWEHWRHATDQDVTVA